MPLMPTAMVVTPSDASAVYGSAASGSALSPPSGRYVVSLLTGTTTVNSIAAGQVGDILTLVASGQAAGVCVVLTQAGNILLRDNQGLGIYAGESLTFVYDGSSWREIDRNLKTVVGYSENTGNKTSTQTAENNVALVLGHNTITFDGVTRFKIELFAPSSSHSAATSNLLVDLWDGGSNLGRIGATREAGGAGQIIGPFKAETTITPSNASHTYELYMWGDAGTMTLVAGAGGAGNYAKLFSTISRAI